MVDSELRFGTSGLRGPVRAFTPGAVAAATVAFVDHLRTSGFQFDRIIIGWDRRPSSPAIASLCAKAASGCGVGVLSAGIASTPAIAAAGLARALPAIIVTGSHVPADRNGLKFCRPNGELGKDDEAPIRALMDLPLPAATPAIGAIEPLDVNGPYVNRMLDFFDPRVLAGLKIGVWLHSAAGGEVLAGVLESLGAELHRYGASQAFVAVDTEALEVGWLDMARHAITSNGLDGVVSTDGDGDRPLIIDGGGRALGGDVIGALTASALGIAHIVTPITSTGALEQSGWFKSVTRTPIGSPHVIKGLENLAAQGAPAAGFEANGGFLLGHNLAGPKSVLTALPTRDALLPIVAVLAEANRRRIPIARLACRLPERPVLADRLTGVSPDRGGPFLQALADDRSARLALDSLLADPVKIDRTDGVRLTLGEGNIVHFRQSGNAPELRCYVETGQYETSGHLLVRMMAALAAVPGLVTKTTGGNG